MYSMMAWCIAGACFVWSLGNVNGARDVFVIMPRQSFFLVCKSKKLSMNKLSCVSGY